MTNYHFGKSQRLLKPDEFRQVFDAPLKKVHGEHLLVFVQKNNTSHARLGLAITKKKLKRAVDRNYIKRITREAFRHASVEMGAVDVVLIIKKNYTKDWDMYAEIVKIFEKIKNSYPKTTPNKNLIPSENLTTNQQNNAQERTPC
ncbi:ribonuclease P protein component [Moraxella caviae]|uniref:Ribonuclease P protein component n=1 Tax=Moraxella caviae TaxID=34060 RepID=A0A1S9ZYY3_9GAMM|nr:ribonuclease P protein component [Moraxella caviae]OOR88161.1 ribonuclease P protein component [Moraxella caviae]STZ10516.1 Ribonuclease P protein component [Moraxella caviae]VEW14276.1 Ribonuclease P protein component [Moraxella caviae]